MIRLKSFINKVHLFFFVSWQKKKKKHLEKVFHVCVAMNCGLLDQGCLVCTLSGRVQRICLRALLENMSCGFGRASALAGLLRNASATALEVPEPARSRDAWIRNQSLALSHDSRGQNAGCK